MAHRAFTELFHPSRLVAAVRTSSHDLHPASCLFFSTVRLPRSCFWSSPSPFSWCPAHSNIAIIISIFPNNMTDHFLTMRLHFLHPVASYLFFPVVLWYFHGLAIGFGGFFVGTCYGTHPLLSPFHDLLRDFVLGHDYPQASRYIEF